MNHDKSNRRVVMAGTALDTMSGISSVVLGYVEAGLFKRFAIRYVVTHRDGSTWVKLLAAINALLRLVWIAATERRVLLHIHLSSRASFWRKALYTLVWRVFRHPYLLHVHGSEFMDFYRDECGSFARSAVRRVFSRAAYIIALSESWREDLQTIARDTPIEVLHNAVLIPPPRPKPAARRPIVLFLGRLGTRKGVDTLLHAFSSIADDFPEIDLICAGDGEIAKTLASAVELGLADRVECPGWLRGNDKEALLSRAVLFVLPSRAEGLPMALLEAMAYGLPVIASRVGGMPEVVQDGREGYLIEPGDAAGLAEAMRRLLGNPERREIMAANSRRRVQDTYSLEVILEHLEAIYRRLEARPVQTRDQAARQPKVAG